MSPPLTQPDLEQFGPLARIRQFQLLDEIDSTNKYLLDNAATLADGTIAAAEVQTAGRGRQGRSWHAPRGSSVLLSVLVHEPAETPLLSRAAMLGAVAAREAVSLIGRSPARGTIVSVVDGPYPIDIDADIRWPNDICIGGRKIAGVLAQSTSLWCGGGRGIVIGIGINVLQNQADFSGELSGKATSLAAERERRAQVDAATRQSMIESPTDRAAVAGALVERLDRWLTAVRDEPRDVWPRLRAVWKQRCRDLGSRVTLVHDGQSYRGVIAAIADDGDLLVELDTGERKSFGAATTTRSW